MKLISKIKIDGNYFDFEFEGNPAEIDDLPNSVEKLKDSIKSLLKG